MNPGATTRPLTSTTVLPASGDGCDLASADANGADGVEVRCGIHDPAVREHDIVGLRPQAGHASESGQRCAMTGHCLSGRAHAKITFCTGVSRYWRPLNP